MLRGRRGHRRHRDARGARRARGRLSVRGRGERVVEGRGAGGGGEEDERGGAEEGRDGRAVCGHRGQVGGERVSEAGVLLQGASFSFSFRFLLVFSGSRADDAVRMQIFEKLATSEPLSPLPRPTVSAAVAATS